MGTGEQNLTIKAGLEGGKQTADGLDKISVSQKELTENVTESIKPTTKIIEETKNLSSSESDLISLLAAVSPALARFADAAIKGSRVAGDLASQNINLTGALDKARKAIAGNTKALSLLVAGGAAAVGIALIASAFSKVKQEAAAAAKAIRDQADALDELASKRSDSQADIEKLSASRREGPFSAAESEAAQTRKQQLGKQSPFVSDDAQSKAVLLGGADASLDKLERIAILLDQIPRKLDVDRLNRTSPDRRSNVIDRVLERNSERIDTIIARERTQSSQLAGKAGRQKDQFASGTADIERFIREKLPDTFSAGLDVKLLAKVAQGLDEARERNANFDTPFEFGQVKDASNIGGNVAVDLIRGGNQIQAKLEFLAEKLQAEGITNESGEAVSPVLVNTAEQVIRFIERENKKNNTTINNTFNNQGSTFLGSDEAARDQRIKDSGRGENARELAEG